MTNHYQINNLESEEDIKQIVDAINNFNSSQIDSKLIGNSSKINLVVKNNKGELLGGILSYVGILKGLEIHILWVKGEYQKQKIGSRLLKEAESIAKTKGAIKSMLDTFSFQAKDFYLKNGYKVFGEIEDFPKGHSRFYLVKDLK